MKTTGELRRDELARRVEDLRTAFQDRDIERVLAFFADDAEVTAAPDTFRGKAAIHQFFEWDARISPAATVRDTGLGVQVVGLGKSSARPPISSAPAMGGGMTCPPVS